ncbi:hypothetical protein ACLB2K_028467 [Fragaria x ananassa]
MRKEELILKELNRNLLVLRYIYQKRHSKRAGNLPAALIWRSVIHFAVLKAPGMDVLEISLSTPQVRVKGVRVWEWTGDALDEGDDASKWFSDYLGKPTSRLVRFNSASATRPVKSSFWSHKPVEPEYARGKQIMFSDLFPYMIASQIPKVNQETGIEGTEPNETLKKFRSDAIVYPSRKQRGRYTSDNIYRVGIIMKRPKFPCTLNTNLIAGVKGNVVRVGDLLHVLNMVSSADEVLE